MKRALVGTLALVSLMATPAVAQDADWPTSAELRDALTAARGWHWGAAFYHWEGGPGGLGDEDRPPVAVIGGGPLSVQVVFNKEEATWQWPLTIDSGWTAFVEVTDRLPVDPDTRVAMLDQLFQGAGSDCVDYSIPGGTVSLNTFSDGRTYAYFNEAGRPLCALDDEVEATASPAS